MMKIKNKKSIFIIVFLLVISSTVAYLYSTDTFQNIFVAASYKVALTETFESPDNWKPGDTTPKTATLKNEGTVPIKVRVKLEEEWKDSNNQDLPLQYNEENVAIINFSNEDDYIYKDGYYYYDLALNPGETTSSIIESVTFNPNYSGTITCIENDDSTHTCSSSDDGYEGGTYKLTLTIEGVQEDYYVQAWGLSGLVGGPYLYNVLRNESDINGLAREYVGQHHDSFTEEPTKKIYHWYASNDSEGTEVQNKNNVIFADHCWQMIRTTDTGGVKMIYNGEVEDEKCLNTRDRHTGYTGYYTHQILNRNYWYGSDYTYDSTNKLFKLSGKTEQAIWSDTTGPSLIGKYTCKSTTELGTCSTLFLVDSYNDETAANLILLQSSSFFSRFGTLSFNRESLSPADVGYMYNIRYPRILMDMNHREKLLLVRSLSTSYWYADSISYDLTTGKYLLDNSYQVTSISDYNNLIGKYTFSNTTQDYTSASVYYIVGVNGSTMYYISIGDSLNHILSDYDYTYTYGDSFNDNGDGTYIINNPTTIKTSDWYTSYNRVYRKYVCKNAVNDTCSDLWYTTSTSNTEMTYMKVANNYKYSKGFTWDGNKYVLDNDESVTFWNISDSTNKKSINNAHYTCWNQSGECTSISYIYYINGTTLNYVNLVNGKSIEDAINEMLYNNDVNMVNSTIKTGIDAWYKHFLLDKYDNYVEDTIYCFDRSQRNADTNGWNSNGGDISTNMYFKGYNVRSDLSCANITDKFSVSNNMAKLTYKVGLMSRLEMDILNNYSIRSSEGYPYWLGTPTCFLNDEAVVSNIGSSGNLTNYFVYYTYGVRPAISLKPGIEYTYGDGSMENPYIVKTE